MATFKSYPEKDEKSDTRSELWYTAMCVCAMVESCALTLKEQGKAPHEPQNIIQLDEQSFARL